MGLGTVMALYHGHLQTYAHVHDIFLKPLPMRTRRIYGHARKSARGHDIGPEVMDISICMGIGMYGPGHDQAHIL